MRLFNLILLVDILSQTEHPQPGWLNLSRVGFTKTQLEAFRDAAVPDLVSTGCRLLFVGINPGLWTAATQTHFCHPSNRFYPALREAGLIDWDLDASIGMTAEQRDDFLSRSMGITNLVNRATARASELGRTELRLGAKRLTNLVGSLTPAVVAVAGITAYREAFGEPDARPGPQTTKIVDSELWVVPNPSGLNAHETVETLAVSYLTAARAAAIV